MKKNIIQITLILFLLFSLMEFTVQAKELPAPSEEIRSVLEQQLSEAAMERLCRREEYDQNGITALSPEEMPILRIYYGPLYFYYDLPIEKAVEKMADESEEYLLYGEDAVYNARFFTKRKQERIFFYSYEEKYPDCELFPYLCDILSLDTILSEEGHNGAIRSIYLVVSREIDTFIITDEGNFVLHYSGELTEGTLYTEEEYREHAKLYYAYLATRYYLYGSRNGTISLEGFIERYDAGKIPAVHRTAMTLYLHPVITGIGAAVLLAGIVTAIIVIVKKIKRKKAA